MKILLTGGTGFLGKQFLKRILQNPQLEICYIISRKRLPMIHEKIQSLQADLTQSSCIPMLQENVGQIDHVVHLAGSRDNYLQNVVTTEFLLEFAKSRSAHFHLASCPFSSTKDLAEDLVLKSKLKNSIYRFGLLVGDSKRGVIERVDGPYLLLKRLYLLSKLPGTSFLPIVPFVGNPKVKLSLVPVDCAADILVQNIVNIPLEGVLGIYPDKLLDLERFYQLSLRSMGMKRAKPKFLAGESGVPLLSSALPVAEPNLPVTEFDSYQEVFFRGFQEWMKDQQDAKN